MTRFELIAKLLITRHLSAAERDELGGKEISLDEVADAIRQLLQENRYFPPDQSPWKPGESVYEGFIIEKLANGKFRLYRQRAHPLAPWQLAESKISDHRNLDPILKEFVRWEWARGIDGIAIQKRMLWSWLRSI